MRNTVIFWAIDALFPNQNMYRKSYFSFQLWGVRWRHWFNFGGSVPPKRLRTTGLESASLGSHSALLQNLKLCTVVRRRRSWRVVYLMTVVFKENCRTIACFIIIIVRFTNSDKLASNMQNIQRYDSSMKIWFYGFGNSQLVPIYSSLSGISENILGIIVLGYFRWFKLLVGN